MKLTALIIVFGDDVYDIILDGYLRHEGTIVVIVLFDITGLRGFFAVIFLLVSRFGVLLLAGTNKQCEEKDEKYSHDAWSFEQI